ncbi:MAG TPA: family 10 glycosylhydrolase, partial [Gemmatimonadaceae bacterium]|nr:family 10 glycosylhydrolase [Gemmatimonadaceae bacterium]
LVEALYKGVHAVKPWVRVGISPFGIWRPGNPPQIAGLDSYAEIYADSRKWLRNGWADYLAPQLYWPIAQTQQSFPVLYDWWLSQNSKGRHVWPGLATYRVAEVSARHITAQEIIDEIDTTRARSGDLGHIHYNMSALMKNPDSLDEKLVSRYAAPALVPASPWLGATSPSRPTITLEKDKATGEHLVDLVPKQGEKVWLWTVRTLANGVWTQEVLPGWLRLHRLPTPNAERVYVAAVSRTGIESAAASAAITRPAAPPPDRHDSPGAPARTPRR